jgi:hypothetical protein
MPPSIGLRRRNALRLRVRALAKSMIGEISALTAFCTTA